MAPTALRLLPLEFAIRFARPVEPWAFFGATLRGGLGYMLKKFFCVRSRGGCGGCPLTLTCVYRKLFEPGPAAGQSETRGLPGIADPPRPFILEYAGGERVSSTDLVRFRLVLVGEAAACYHYLIYAFIELGEQGLARERLKFTVERVDQMIVFGPVMLYTAADQTIRPAAASPPPLKTVPESPTLTFLTPVRIKHNGKYAWNGSFFPLCQALLWRLTLLEKLYGGGAAKRDGRAMVAAARQVPIREARLEWRDLKRFSTRQKQKTLHGGYAGTVAYGPVPPELRPLLAIGELLHVGHNATFGLGAYRIGGDPDGDGRADRQEANG